MTDGVSPAKSFKKKFWPVIFGLVELPRTLRDSIRNKIVSGVYFGNQKPTSNMLFSSLIQQINELNQKGIGVFRNNEEITVKIGFYGFTGDGIFLNIEHHYLKPSLLLPALK